MGVDGHDMPCAAVMPKRSGGVEAGAFARYELGCLCDRHPQAHGQPGVQCLWIGVKTPDHAATPAQIDNRNEILGCAGKLRWWAAYYGPGYEHAVFRRDKRLLGERIG